jgi:hypothetical protein
MMDDTNNTAPAAGAARATAKRHYYAASDLRYDDVDVIVLTPGGDECVARRKTVWRRRQATTVWRVRVPVREPGRPTRCRYVDLPEHLEITRWRPLAGFPGPLPKPAHMVADVRWQTPAEPPAPPEQSDDLEWPHDYSAAPDISEREVEVRVLRGLRTMRSPHAVKDGRARNQVDSVLNNLLRQMGKIDYDHIDESYMAPAGVAWEPTRRDHGDWLTATGWWRQLSRTGREIVVFRSMNPPYSFQAIGDREGITREGARKRYRAAIERLVRIANGLVG